MTPAARAWQRYLPGLNRITPLGRQQERTLGQRARLTGTAGQRRPVLLPGNREVRFNAEVTRVQARYH